MSNFLWGLFGRLSGGGSYTLLLGSHSPPALNHHEQARSIEAYTPPLENSSPQNASPFSPFPSKTYAVKLTAKVVLIIFQNWIFLGDITTYLDCSTAKVANLVRVGKIPTSFVFHKGEPAGGFWVGEINECITLIHLCSASTLKFKRESINDPIKYIMVMKVCL